MDSLKKYLIKRVEERKDSQDLYRQSQQDWERKDILHEGNDIKMFTDY